jgi:glycosyltransferase involved in cell wall biosynthesis
MNRVTVLLPVYNGVEFLAETIDSVLNQTYTDFDFLIINDASTDKSEEIILSYTDSRIQYLLNERNLGSIGSPQKGMDIIQTEYIARIDQDDIWLPTKLEKQIQLMDANPLIGICGTSIELFGDRSGFKIFPMTHEHLKVGLLFFCCMSHPSVVFRKSFLMETGITYNEAYNLADDYKMWIDCIDLTRIYNIPEPLVRYRQHKGQICSAANAPKQMLVQNKVRLEMLERISPKFSQNEKDFHINRFVEGQIESINDYKQFAKWSRLMCQRNKQDGKYIDPNTLSDNLNYHLQIFLKRYILIRFFPEMNMKALLRYFFSFNWIYLSARRNIGIAKQCFFN